MKVALLTLALVASTSASAFVCTRTFNAGPSVFWSDRTIVMRPNGGGREVSAGELERVLQRGTTSWSDVDCADVALETGRSTLQSFIGFNWHAGSGDAINQNIVLFRNDTEGDDLDRWLHNPGVIALTTITFDSQSGRLLDADIEINDTNFIFTTCDLDEASCRVAFDLENTLTHELGHVLGLDHPPDAPEATMFATAVEGQLKKRDLDDDDINGLCTIYPSGLAVPGECYGVARPPPSSVVFSQSLCAGAGGAGAWASPLALLAGLASRAARRKMRRR